MMLHTRGQNAFRLAKTAQEGPPTHPAWVILFYDVVVYFWCDVAVSVFILELLLLHPVPARGAATTEGVACFFM